MSTLKFTRLLFPLFLIIHGQGMGQSGADQKKNEEYDQLKSRIESKQFYFHAQSATTQKGKTIQLTNEYFLKLNNDSLQADLPYYGRAYAAPYSSSDQALGFKTTEFKYSADTTKKGGWDILIEPKNASGVSKINLSVTSGGYCTVHIISNTRSAISFYGTIQAYKYN
jgi:Domain of unknown function (DUF4251)